MVDLNYLAVEKLVEIFEFTKGFNHNYQIKPIQTYQNISFILFVENDEPMEAFLILNVHPMDYKNKLIWYIHPPSISKTSRPILLKINNMFNHFWSDKNII